MSSADLWEDGYPHGTVEGYLGGCRGGACPAGLDHGLTCKRAKMLDAGDVRYRRLVRQGKTPAEIADALGEHPAEPTTQAPDREKRHLKALEREISGADDKAPTTPTKEPRMPTPADVAKTTKPLTEHPVADTDVVDEHAAAQTSRDEPTPITTERWTAGLNVREKTAKLREIREWARANGHDVPTMGKIPHAALAAYARFEELVSGATTPETPADTPDAAQPLAERSQDTAPQEDAGAPAIEEEAPAAGTPAAEVEEMGHPTDETIPYETADGVVVAVDLDGTVHRAKPEATDSHADEEDLSDDELEQAAREIRADIDAEIAEIGAACRVCGCTDWDCTQCIERTGVPCSWVKSDLCSACVPLTEIPALPADEFAQAMAAARERAELEQLNRDADGEPDLPAQETPDQADDFRPDWAGVTVPADIRQARSIAARLEEENARLLEELDELNHRHAVLGDQLSDTQIDMRRLNSSLELALRKWAEASDRLEQLQDADEHLDIAADRIQDLERDNLELREKAADLRGQIRGRDELNAQLVARLLSASAPVVTLETAKRSPWWKRGAR